MKSTVKQRAIAWILSFCLVLTLSPELGYALDSTAGKTVAGTESVAPDDVTEEDVVEKTEDTTTYDLGNNRKMAVFHGAKVRYEDEKGKLLDYDPSLVRIKEGAKSSRNHPLKGYAYENKQGDKKHYLPKTLSEDTPVLLENGDYGIEFSLADENLEEIQTVGDRKTWI